MPAHVPPVADEREALLGYLAHQRQGVRIAAHGLTDAEAAATPTAGTLSIGAIVKHLAQTERWWIELVREGTAPMNPAAYVEGWRFDPGDDLSAALDDYARCAHETEKAMAEIDDLGQSVQVPRGVSWLPQDVDAWSVRWVLLHLIEETARHAGHADIVRESLDGASAISLLAAAEHWPATEWVQPWERKGENR